MKKLLPKISSILILIMWTGLFTSCEKVNKSESTPKFAIYFVKEESKRGAISYGRNEHTQEYVKPELNLKDLVISDSPIVTEKNVKKYDWKTHTIELTEEYIKNHNIEIKKEEGYENIGSKLLGAKEFDAVVIVCNGKRIYCAGVPFSGRWSCFPPEIMIKDNNEKSITITKNGKNTYDVRENENIYKTLKEIGVLVE